MDIKSIITFVASDDLMKVVISVLCWRRGEWYQCMCFCNWKTLSVIWGVCFC